MIPEKGFSSIDELQDWLECRQSEPEEIQITIDDDLKSQWDTYCLQRFGKPLEDSFDELADCQLLFHVLQQNEPPNEHQS